MAFKHGKASKVLVGDKDLSADFTQYNWGKARQTVDVTTFGSSGHHDYLAGLGEGTFSCQGVWNPALSDSELVDINGTRTVISASPTTFAAIGDRVHMVNGYIENYQPRSAQNDAVRFSSGFQAAAGAYLGVTLHELDAETGAANFASVDQSAQSTNGARAFLHVTAFTGTDATVTVEDSSDDAVFASLGAFTQVTGTTSEAIEITGTVEQYVRVALTGTFTSITFTVSFHRSRI